MSGLVALLKKRACFFCCLDLISASETCIDRNATVRPAQFFVQYNSLIQNFLFLWKILYTLNTNQQSNRIKKILHIKIYYKQERKG